MNYFVVDLWDEHRILLHLAASKNPSGNKQSKEKVKIKNPDQEVKS